MDLSNLATEQINPATTQIDRLDTLSMLNLINEEDKKAALAVEAVLPDIARAVDLITSKITEGGRLFYIGAGTSGRPGVLRRVGMPADLRSVAAYGTRDHSGRRASIGEFARGRGG